MVLDILLGILAFLTAVNGLLGKTVEDFNELLPKPLIRRIRRPGWSFLILSVLTFSIGTYKTIHSTFAARMESVYPKFKDIIDEKTGHTLDEWEKYMSYRVSLRFELQQLYSKVFAPPTITPESAPAITTPESMARTLRDLGRRGAIPNDLCLSLDYIRWNTYYVEWGTEGPSPIVLDKVSKLAKDALPELERITSRINVQELRANDDSPCGKNPEK